MYRSIIKRGLDFLTVILLIPFFIIIFIPIAIAIKLEDRNSIFYTSTRIGKDKKEFQMYKFRSMKENAPDIRNNDGTTYNSENDSRVTKVGRFLRKSSLDEVPQIINIFKGDMSLIGPRPSPLGDKSHYSKDFFLKFLEKPGITGLSQAKVRNNATMDERIELDKFYINNISFFLDFKIIFWTILAVIKKNNINRN